MCCTCGRVSLCLPTSPTNNASAELRPSLFLTGRCSSFAVKTSFTPPVSVSNAYSTVRAGLKLMYGASKR